jgi:hypothetical protein
MSTQTQEYVAPQGVSQEQNQQTGNPFWYRQNAGYLYGVTSAPSNMQFGIEDISIKPASANQIPHGILGNGLLKSVVGSISFQIRLSKSNAPFVQTVSTAIDKEKGEYWEHIMLKAQVKAQILRFFEALQTGQVPPPPMPQQQMYGMQPQQQFGMQQQFGQQPMYGMGMQQPPMGMQPQYGMPQQQFGMPQQQQQSFPQYGQPQQQYQPPAPQNMGGQATEQPNTEAQKEVVGLQEDDLPI